MREIEPTTRFRRDYKREKKGAHAKLLDQWLTDVANTLAADKALPSRCRDHALTGEWKDHRDCHIRPDLVLIYRLIGTDTLELVRLGSHSELGL
jgi:mRNA interferase YafQ